MTVTGESNEHVFRLDNLTTLETNNPFSTPFGKFTLRTNRDQQRDVYYDEELGSQLPHTNHWNYFHQHFGNNVKLLSHFMIKKERLVVVVPRRVQLSPNTIASCQLNRFEALIQPYPHILKCERGTTILFYQSGCLSDYFSAEEILFQIRMLKNADRHPDCAPFYRFVRPKFLKNIFKDSATLEVLWWNLQSSDKRKCLLNPQERQVVMALLQGIPLGMIY